MLKRHEVEILRKARHPKTEVARLSGVSLPSVKRIAEEGPVTPVDDVAERGKRQIGRPSMVASFQKHSSFVCVSMNESMGVTTCGGSSQEPPSHFKPCRHLIIAEWRIVFFARVWHAPVVGLGSLSGRLCQETVIPVVTRRDTPPPARHRSAERSSHSRAVRLACLHYPFPWSSVAISTDLNCARPDSNPPLVAPIHSGVSRNRD